MRLAKMTTILMFGATGALAAEAHVRQILVSIPDRKLVLLEDGQVKRIFDVAVGKESTPSPVGSFQIASRVKNPTWYGPKGVVVPPGKSNPLGTRWMGLGYKGYGIHGTNAPNSIGKAASHGCIRMKTKEAEELFALVENGDTVELLGERTDQIAQILDAPATTTAAATATAESAGGGQ